MQYLEQVESWLYGQFPGIEEKWLLALSGVSIVTLFFAVVALVMILILGHSRRSFTKLKERANSVISGLNEGHNEELSRIRDEHASVVSDLEEQRAKHENEIEEMHKAINSAHEAQEAAEARARELRAGWVYIASNVGSFGPDVYKIGMTKKEDPDMRLTELSDASVPFPFELHARVQSEDAIGLKTELHQYFSDYSFNMANTRREFFKVPFSQIKEKLLELDPNAEIVREEPEAQEYKRSQYLMREKQQT